MTRAFAAGVLAVTACVQGTGPSGRPNPPAAAIVSSGADQVRFPGSPLLSSVVIRVVDDMGAPTGVSGLPVTWRIVEGGGLVAGSDTTDTLGISRAAFTLGASTGTHQVEARVAELAPVQVSARAVHPGPILFVSNRRAGYTGDPVAGFPGDLYVMNEDGADVIVLSLSNLPFEYASHPA